MRVLHVGWGFHPWRFGGLIEYAEDLMEAQVALRYQIAYFFAGRYYPFLRSTRLKLWHRRGIQMYELLNGPIYAGGDLGIRDPATELNNSCIDGFFSRAIDHFKPEIIHFQEFFEVPSSLIEIAKTRGIPAVMTLLDYYLLCPTMKLYDYTGTNCTRADVGEICVRCCAGAPTGPQELIFSTLKYEAHQRIPRLLFPAAGFFLKIARKRPLSAFLLSRVPELARTPAPRHPIDAFQRRRDTNVQRLTKIDLLVAHSLRTAEIYKSCGIPEGKIVCVQSAIRHTDSIHPTVLHEISGPINFVTLNGCATVPKGAYLILDAIERLTRAGLQDRFKVFILGGLLNEVRDAILKFANVAYMGPYAVRHLNHLLEGMHAGIVPSIWEEVYGYVGIEMLAKGIPVIGNMMGGITDYVVDGATGWLNTTNDGAGLAEVMARIIRNPGEIVKRNRFVISRRETIIMPMSRHADEIAEIYERVTAQKARAN